MVIILFFSLASNMREREKEKEKIYIIFMIMSLLSLYSRQTTVVVSEFFFEYRSNKHEGLISYI